ncbi:MAG: chaperone NapD [Alphaproteobacteria bacterium]
MNICGVLVHCASGEVASVEKALAAIPGVELHSRIHGDRLIVTAEDTDTANAGESILAIHNLPGVITATLTYHSFEELDGRGSDSPTVVQS